MKAIQSISINKISLGGRIQVVDQLAVEEPLEIQLRYGKADDRQQQSVSITMRTPGNDFDLAIGFLFTEGIIENFEEVSHMSHPPHWNEEAKENIVLVELEESVTVDLKKMERHFYTTSSCGVCGKTSIEALYSTKKANLPKNHPLFEATLLQQLPTQLRQEQSVFEQTGGIHAAAIFDNKGQMKLLREDVGRHNAVDKLIGAALEKKLLPLQDYLILVSGRASFELIQKALMADIPILAAVGAPSSLAVSLAETSGMTLIGFVKADSCNVYTFPDRIL